MPGQWPKRFCQDVLRSGDAALNVANSVVKQGEISSQLFIVMWQTISTSQMLVDSISEFVALAQIYVVMHVGSIDDERSFSALTYLKDERRNRLDS